MKKMGHLKHVMEAGQDDVGAQWRIFWGTDEEMWDD